MSLKVKSWAVKIIYSLGWIRAGYGPEIRALIAPCSMLAQPEP